jgi:hypothetical protein
MKNPQTLEIKTLSGEWHDNDTVMLQACFHLLTDCIENEHLFTGHVDWKHNEESIKAKDEIEGRYAWWVERKNADLEEKINHLDKSQYDKDNEMLIRLINVKQWLWT